MTVSIIGWQSAASDDSQHYQMAVSIIGWQSASSDGNQHHRMAVSIMSSQSASSDDSQHHRMAVSIMRWQSALWDGSQQHQMTALSDGSQHYLVTGNHLNRHCIDIWTFSCCCFRLFTVFVWFCCSWVVVLLFVCCFILGVRCTWTGLIKTEETKIMSCIKQLKTLVTKVNLSLI